MLVPTLVCVLCFIGGTAAAARWLPELGTGLIGGLAFFTVCGLLGMVLSLLGLHIYEIAKEPSALGLGSGLILAGELEELLRDVGGLLGLAGIVYLLAPRLPSGTTNVAAQGSSPER